MAVVSESPLVFEAITTEEICKILGFVPEADLLEANEPSPELLDFLLDPAVPPPGERH